MNLAHVTALVITYNEAPNIGRTLSALASLPQVVLVDSGSTDETLAIAARFPNVKVLTRAFDDHARQCAWGLAHCGTEWVLSLDADHVMAGGAMDEIAALEPAPEMAAYRAPFRYFLHGRMLSSTLYPPRIVLFRKQRARFVQDGHAHRVVAEGQVGDLRTPIVHDDRKPLARWIASQLSYAALEAQLLRTRPWRALSWPDRLRRLVVVTPWLVPLYCLTVGRGVLDGWQGLYYAFQRGIAETLLSLELLEPRNDEEQAR